MKSMPFSLVILVAWSVGVLSLVATASDKKFDTKTVAGDVVEEMKSEITNLETIHQLNSGEQNSTEAGLEAKDKRLPAPSKHRVSRRSTLSQL